MELRAENAALRARVAELERQLGHMAWIDVIDFVSAHRLPRRPLRRLIASELGPVIEREGWVGPDGCLDFRSPLGIEADVCDYLIDLLEDDIEPSSAAHLMWLYEADQGLPRGTFYRA